MRKRVVTHMTLHSLEKSFVLYGIQFRWLSAFIEFTICISKNCSLIAWFNKMFQFMNNFYYQSKGSSSPDTHSIISPSFNILFHNFSYEKLDRNFYMQPVQAIFIQNWRNVLNWSWLYTIWYHLVLLINIQTYEKNLASTEFQTFYKCFVLHFSANKSPSNLQKIIGRYLKKIH